MVINVQLIANALGIAAWGFGVPLVAPADRDFLAIKAEPRHRFGRSDSRLACDQRSQSGRANDVGPDSEQ